MKALPQIAMVYQEPLASLNPGMRIGPQLKEVSMIREGVSRANARSLSLQMGVIPMIDVESDRCHLLTTQSIPILEESRLV